MLWARKVAKMVASVQGSASKSLACSAKASLKLVKKLVVLLPRKVKEVVMASNNPHSLNSCQD